MELFDIFGSKERTQCIKVFLVPYCIALKMVEKSVVGSAVIVIDRRLLGEVLPGYLPDLLPIFCRTVNNK